MFGAWGTLPSFSTRRGRGACWGSGIRLGRGTIILLHGLASKTNHKLVSSHLGTPLVLGQATSNLDSLDSPRPGFEGSHHLPPYKILCSSSRRLHLNGTFSRDSQGRVPKLSRFGLSGLWASITSCSNLRLGWGLKQPCSSLGGLSNSMLHSSCRCRIWVDSQLLVVRSQTASLTPDLSFAHNLNYKCPNDSCEAILDIYTSRPFQWYKKKFNARCFVPWTEALSFRESQRIPSSHFWEHEFHLTVNPKWGCDTNCEKSKY